MNLKNKKITVLHFSKWHEVCGIADYTRDMVSALNAEDIINYVYPIKEKFCEDKKPQVIEKKLAAFYAKATSVDLIHIQHQFSFFGNNLKDSIQNFYRVLKKLNKLKKSVVVSFHTEIQFFNTNIHEIIEGKKFIKTLMCWGLKWYWQYKILSFFKGNSHFHAIVHTNKSKFNLINCGLSAEKIDVIPLGLLPRNNLAITDKAIAKKKLGYPKDIVLLSIFGFITKNKGYQFAIQALKLLPPHYHLAIVGGPNPQAKKLILDKIFQQIEEDELIKNRIRVTGYVDAATRDLYHDATNICLAPYHGNVSGSAGIGWALSSGNPVIASRISTFNEINQQANCFLLCAQESSFELAWSIEYLIANVDLQTKLVKNALKYAAANQWSNVVHQVINCYKKSIGKIIPCTIILSNAVSYHMMVDAEARDLVSPGCKQGNPYQKDAVELMLCLLNPGDKVLDIGANIGTFSLAAAAHDCDVIAIEASPFQAELIKYSAKTNQFAQLQVVNTAISAVSGSICNLLKEVEWEIVNFIKMDMEGFEMSTLISMVELLRNSNAPSIFYKANISELEKCGQTLQTLKTFLEELGYQNYLFDKGRLVSVQAEDFQARPCVDYLAVKESTERYHTIDAFLKFNKKRA